MNETRAYITSMDHGNIVIITIVDLTTNVIRQLLLFVILCNV